MTLAQLANHFRGVEERAVAAPEVAAERTAPILVAEARAVLGNSPPLRALLESTQDERERKGYPRNAPLVREGSYRDSIVGGAEGPIAFAGTASPLGAMFEYGTVKMQPFAPMAIAREAALPQALAIATQVAREVLEG